MKKITLIMFSLFAIVSLWQVNGQSYTGDNVPADIFTNSPVTSSANSTIVGSIGSEVGSYKIDNVGIDINHTYTGDLDITLTSPSGTTLDLSTGNGSFGDNYDGTVFEDGAPSITTGSAPFDGVYSAEGGSMNDTFAGEDAAGDWELVVVDNAFGDNGTLTAYSISFSENLPPAPYLLRQDCSQEMPLEFNPPLLASAGVVVADSGFPSDTGIVGTGLGEYVLESVVINVEGEMAEDVDFFLQPAGTTILWALGVNAGGTDGMDTAVDLTFTDSSSNNYSDWTGGAPAADYLPADGAFNTALAGLDINGEWFLVVQGVGSDVTTVNSFCINWAMSSGDAPDIFCIADFAADNDEGVCGAVVNFAPPIALDTEDGPLAAANIVQTGGLPTGSEFPVGNNDVTFTATDSHGNETSCTFVVTVNDAEAPVAVCQAFTVVLDEDGLGSMLDSDIDGGSTDNCAVDSVVASQTAFSCADVGEVTVVLEVFDAAGNSSTCEATVTVVDETAPVIACIGEPSGDGAASTVSGAPIEVDVVVSVLTLSDDVELQDLNVNLDITHEWIGDMIITLTSPAGTTVTLLDTMGGGAFGCSGDGVLVTLDDDAAEGINDQCDVLVTGVYSPLEALAAFNGEMSMGDWTLSVTDTFTAFDDGVLNSWGVDFQYEPVVTPPLLLDLNADGTVTVPASDLLLDVIEACDYSVVSGSTGPCSQSNPGNNLEGATFNNGAPFATANDFTATGDFTLTQITMNLWHNVGASVADMTFTYYADAAGQPGAAIGTETVSPTSQTVVGGPFDGAFDASEVVYDITPVEFAAGTYWIGTVGAASDAGVLGWENTTASSNGNGWATSGDGGATWSVDAGGDGVYTFSGVCGVADPLNFTFDCSNLGENVVEVFVTDASGNTSSCFTTVVVSDVTAPVLVCGPGDGATTVTVDFDGSSAPAGWSVSNTAGGFDWTFGASGAGAPGGTEPFATNAAIFDDDAAGNGNVNNASLLTPVWDMSAATSVTMSYDYSFNELGAGETLTVDVYDGTAWQNVVTYDMSVLTPENSGVIDGSALANAEFQVRFTYDDAGSWGWNAGVDNFQIDFVVPPANPDVVTVELGEDGMAELDATDFLTEGFDACGIDVLIADLEMVSCDDIGTPIEVTVFATDASGNIASCSINVEVVDTMAPVVTCPEDESVMVDPDGTHTVADYIGSGAATATDNCTDPVTFTQDPAAGTVLGVGEWVVTFTATDEYGNVSTCDMNLDLTLLGSQDNELSNAIVLYPNPANEQVTLSNSSNIALETAMIYDLNGKLVSQINLQDMQSERVIDVSSFATGVYMVQITGEQSSVVKRMIKE